MQRSPTPRVRALHVFVLVAFAVAQPLFDLLGRHAEFLIAHGATRGDLYLLTLFLAGVVPGIAQYEQASSWEREVIYSQEEAEADPDEAPLPDRERA